MDAASKSMSGKVADYSVLSRLNGSIAESIELMK
jgi:hypothetical protein